MQLFLRISAIAAIAAALPAPSPQEIDLDMVIAMPDPTYSEAVGVTAQIVTYNPSSLAAQATSAVSSVSVVISDVLSSTAIAKRDIERRTACAPEPTGVSSLAVSPDTASGFTNNAAFASAATDAVTPSGYTNTFNNLLASNNACAAECDAINGCMSFNLYFERDPSVDPGTGTTGCEDPASVTTIKCVFWGGPVSASNANGYGQTRNQFEVVIAGSNGYTNNSIIVPPGYTSATYLGNNAINAPFDAQGYNTFMGSTMFSSGPFNATLCALYCDSQSEWNLANPPSDGSPAKICRFFNTYLIYLNTTADMQGQYCSLYTEAWSSTYATNSGQVRGSDSYFVEYSYTYTNSTDAGFAPESGDENGAIHQATVEMNYYPASLTSTFLPFCTDLLGYTVPSTVVTATPTASSVVQEKNKRALATPDVLTKYPATVVSSACGLIAATPTGT